jgi:cytochrome c oxidase assembly protein subunit 15
MHRMLAILVCVVLGIIWCKSSKLKLNTSQYRGVTFLIYGVTLQFILGVLTLLYHVPVVLGVLHQTGAFFLFATSVYLIFHTFKKN